ncbi:hypothetical protein [Carboxylicivirga taeanensis]
MKELTAYTSVTTKRPLITAHLSLYLSVSSVALISLYGRFGMGLFECWIF